MDASGDQHVGQVGSVAAVVGGCVTVSQCAVRFVCTHAMLKTLTKECSTTSTAAAPLHG